jgi:hypothetical protein
MLLSFILCLNCDGSHCLTRKNDEAPVKNHYSYTLTTEYFLNINKNDNIYCNCNCKMGRIWIHQHLWLELNCKTQELSCMAAAIHSRVGLSAAEHKSL